MRYVCVECGEVFATMRAVHWHLRREHEMEPEEAFELAGDSGFEGERRPWIEKDFKEGNW
jgi:hypothetical protein